MGTTTKQSTMPSSPNKMTSNAMTLNAMINVH